MRWTLPLDQYRDQTLLEIYSFVRATVVANCLDAAGLPYQEPTPVSFDARPGPTWNRAARRLFNIPIAQEYGYRASDFLSPASPEASLADLDTGSGQKTFEQCMNEADELPAIPSTSLAESFTGAAYESSLADPTTLAAAERWRTCMEPQGIADLPEVPWEMPSPTLRDRFGLDPVTPGGLQRQQPEPSAAELELASADAQCREESGVSEAQYQAEIDEQASLLDRNREALEALGEAMTESKETYQRILAEFESGEFGEFGGD